MGKVGGVLAFLLSCAEGAFLLIAEPALNARVGLRQTKLAALKQCGSGSFLAFSGACQIFVRLLHG